MNTSVNLAGVELKNPVMTASGTFGSGIEYGEFVDLNKLGAVVTKGVANVPWPGNPTPRIAETYGGMINAIGLQNPGIDVFCKRDIHDSNRTYSYQKKKRCSGKQVVRKARGMLVLCRRCSICCL